MTKNEDIEFLLRVKKQIDEAGIQLAKKQGEIEAKYKELKTAFKCSNLTAAERKLTTLDKALDKEVAAWEAGVEKLREGYDW